jgi:hypothetical protein
MRPQRVARPRSRQEVISIRRHIAAVHAQGIAHPLPEHFDMSPILKLCGPQSPHFIGSQGALADSAVVALTQSAGLVEVSAEAFNGKATDEWTGCAITMRSWE